MTNDDIENYNEEKIETIEDFVEFWTEWHGFDYEWRNDDGEEYLIVWIDFPALESFSKLLSIDTINECENDFHCIFRHDCIVFPHFERVLEHCYLDEEDFKKIFPI